MKCLLQRIFGTKSDRLSVRRPKAERPRRLTLESLEERQLLSGPGTCSIDFDALTREVTIWGSASADTATVSATSTQVSVSLKCGSLSRSRTFNRADVGYITFWGNNGNDKFTNNTAIGSEAYGEAGKDTLTGG